MQPRPGVRGSWTVTPPPSIVNEPLVLNIKQAAKALGVSQTKLREMERTGEVPVIRIGGLPKVSSAWLRQYVNDKTAAANGPNRATGRTHRGGRLAAPASHPQGAPRP